MTRRPRYASVAWIGAALLVGCASDPPADLSHLPRDASAVWGVDVGAIVGWAGAAAPGPLAQLGTKTWTEGIAACGLDLSEVDIVGAGTDPSDVVVVLRAPGIADTSTLECLGAGAWRPKSGDPWWTVDGSELQREDGTAIGRVISADAFVIATDPTIHDLAALAEGSDEAWSDSMRETLAVVDFRAAIWGAAAPGAKGEDGEDASAVESVAFDVAVPGDLVVHAIVRASEPDAMAETIEAKLREVSGWVYAPTTVVDRAEIEAGDGGVELRLSIALSQWQGMDLRFVDERRGLVKPRPEPEPPSELVAAAIFESPAVELPVAKAVAVPVGPTGIPACDEYLEKYRACIVDKVPEAARESMTAALDTTVDAWKQAAAGPAAASLETACNAARDAAEQATKAMGCSW